MSQDIHFPPLVSRCCRDETCVRACVSACVNMYLLLRCRGVNLFMRYRVCVCVRALPCVFPNPAPVCLGERESDAGILMTRNRRRH